MWEPRRARQKVVCKKFYPESPMCCGNRHMMTLDEIIKTHHDFIKTHHDVMMTLDEISNTCKVS